MNGLIDESHNNYAVYKILVKLFNFSKKKIIYNNTRCDTLTLIFFFYYASIPVKYFKT